MALRTDPLKILKFLSVLKNVFLLLLSNLFIFLAITAFMRDWLILAFLAQKWLET